MWALAHFSLTFPKVSGSKSMIFGILVIRQFFEQAGQNSANFLNYPVSSGDDGFKV